MVSDRGVDCFVIRYLSPNALIERDGNDLIVSGSTILDDLALFAANEALAGLNCTTGIPGTVGGAVVGNAGAFGNQIGDVVKSVKLLTKSGEEKELPASALEFTYRHSKLKETDDIVASVRLALSAGNKKELLIEREEICALRKSKHPDLKVHPCAGSFFRNIEPTSKAGKRQAAGWFLEQSGAKELKHGGAVIFEGHANIICKADGCKSQDVYELSQKMAECVQEKQGLHLVREVRFVGDFKGKPKHNSSVIW